VQIGATERRKGKGASVFLGNYPKRMEEHYINSRFLYV
jgi:hypothetical protein